MPMRFNYYPLAAEDAEEQKPDLKPSYSPQIPSRRVLFIIIFSETLLLLFMFLRHTQTTKYTRPALLYSPAQDAVEYGVTAYAITGEDPLFHIPPSPKLDAAWDELYNCMFILSLTFHFIHATLSRRITNPQESGSTAPQQNAPNSGRRKQLYRGARRLPQPTLLGWSSRHRRIFSVDDNISQNMIRKSLHSGYYSEHLMELAHLDHCVDWIRQSLMCAGDTSVVVWQWDPAPSITTFQGSVAHTCRNFEKLREWGKKHKIQRPYDNSVRIEDDIVIPIIPKDFGLK
ncbi:hypothetical protein C8R45DRAFT_1090732 [Mycena sanguinolenta]|nr:hypothetical protein C8R45DRAFT_1090732 [Mycena sanguinolenta]